MLAFVVEKVLALQTSCRDSVTDVVGNFRQITEDRIMSLPGFSIVEYAPIMKKMMTHPKY